MHFHVKDARVRRKLDKMENSTGTKSGPLCRGHEDCPRAVPFRYIDQMLIHCSDIWAIASAMAPKARCIYDSPYKRFMDILLTKPSLGMNHKLVHKATKTVALETKTLNVSCSCNIEIRNPTPSLFIG